MFTDSATMSTIRRLSGEIRALRHEQAARTGDPQMHVERLQELTTELDQAWHLLRQQRARRAAVDVHEMASVQPR